MLHGFLLLGSDCRSLRRAFGGFLAVVAARLLFF